MARTERSGSKIETSTAHPPSKMVPISSSVWQPTWLGGKFTSVTRSLSEPLSNVWLRHIAWQEMLRCESSAGLGDPVEPVVKITSAPSSGDTRAAASAWLLSQRPVSPGSLQQTRRLAQQRSHANGPGGTFLRCGKLHRQLQRKPRLHLGAKLPCIRNAGSLDEGEARRLHQCQASHQLCMGKPQIQRHKDHSNAEAGILQKDVLAGQRQQAGKEIPFAKAALQQHHRQCPGDGVEFRPRHLPVAVRVDERHRLRLFARPLLHRSMEQVAILKSLFKILEG